MCPRNVGSTPGCKWAGFCSSLAACMGLSRKEAKRAVARELEGVGLADRSSDRIESLSKGLQQRVQLAAALLHSPRVLLLDEPFAGLDPAGVDELSRYVKGHAERGGAVLFSTHVMEQAELICDRVTILKSGRIVRSGAIDDLIERVGRVRVRFSGRSREGWMEGLDCEMQGQDVAVIRWDESPSDLLRLLVERGCEIEQFNSDGSNGRLRGLFLESTAPGEMH